MSSTFLGSKSVGLGDVSIVHIRDLRHRQRWQIIEKRIKDVAIFITCSHNHKLCGSNTPFRKLKCKYIGVCENEAKTVLRKIEFT